MHDGHLRTVAYMAMAAIFQNGRRPNKGNSKNGKYLENEKYFSNQYDYIKVIELNYESNKKIILKIGSLLNEI